jgi:hypothetical protein
MPVDQNGESWAARAARNQALFRAINDELSARGGAGNPGALTIACECADTQCVGTIEIGFDRYEGVRSEATRFVVLRGHIYPDVERVVAEDDGFVVVEKIGEAAVVAAADGAVGGEEAAGS